MTMAVENVQAIEDALTQTTDAMPGYSTNVTRVRVTSPALFDHGQGILNAERAATNTHTSISDPLLIPGALFGVTTGVLSYSILRDQKLLDR